MARKGIKLRQCRNSFAKFHHFDEGRRVVPVFRRERTKLFSNAESPKLPEDERRRKVIEQNDRRVDKAFDSRDRLAFHLHEHTHTHTHARKKERSYFLANLISKNVVPRYWLAIAFV